MNCSFDENIFRENFTPKIYDFTFFSKACLNSFLPLLFSCNSGILRTTLKFEPEKYKEKVVQDFCRSVYKGVYNFKHAALPSYFICMLKTIQLPNVATVDFCIALLLL